MIDGVIIKDLRIIPDEKGDVRHMLRCDDPFFTEFGEVYFSFINPGQVKGWKKHLKQTQCFAVPIGTIKLVIYDDRQQSLTKGNIEEIVVGADAYKLVRIPPGLWYSFSAMNKQVAMITNCTDIPHDPNEAIRKELNDLAIPYVWK
ncbi:MAG: dTDP-4-dehydrorhamnose 3,5-epimerase family protein [Candidatus Omnitrophica bacterium]|nr:dTDP-4-dehydrorhamnose 3,5-epimerase family protein [Candidatus Omnitrophota bacterium]